MLYTKSGEIFASGVLPIQFQPVNAKDSSTRLFIPIELEGFSTMGVVDTGAPYLICAPSMANILQPNLGPSLGREALLIRGVRIGGNLHRVKMNLTAIEGEHLSFEVTAFIPDVDEEAWRTLPTFLGLTGCLERLRFAIDPIEDRFYFGALA